MNPTEKIATALQVMTQQQALIGGLQSAHLDAVKIAAALAEAVKLAQDGAIDVCDIMEVARKAVKTGSVKLSSVDDLFEQSPGDLVGTAKEPGTGGTDPLTSTLRELKS